MSDQSTSPEGNDADDEGAPAKKSPKIDTLSLSATGELANLSISFSSTKDRDGQGGAASPDGSKKEENKKGEEGGGEKPKDEKSKTPPFYKRPGIMGVVIVVVVTAVVAIVLFWRHSRAHETTDDAYVDVVSEQVSPQISGRVAQVLVTDNQTVAVGQVLVKLDPADDQVRLDQAHATRAQAVAQDDEAHAQETAYAAQVDEARANLATSMASQTNTANQLARLQKLKAANAGAVSDEQMDSATAAATTASAQLNASNKAVAAALAQVGYAKSLETAAEAGIESADSSIRQAELTLSYTDVKARVEGRVASKTVSEGNIVAAGTALMAVVPKAVYVTANFKKTQLALMRPGQAVEIKIDAYPDMKLAGKVDSVQAASGQAFSELPAQNATGNWVKVVQRVPVKIIFDKEPDDSARPLGPGMSVEISVKVR